MKHFKTLRKIAQKTNTPYKHLKQLYKTLSHGKKQVIIQSFLDINK